MKQTMLERLLEGTPEMTAVEVGSGIDDKLDLLLLPREKWLGVQAEIRRAL
jgi:hypothetical protein